MAEYLSSPFQWQDQYAALREAWVKALLSDIAAGETIWISVDASSIPRPEAEKSQDRGIIHVSNLPRAVKPISVGWQFFDGHAFALASHKLGGDSRSTRISTEQTAIGVACAQLRASFLCWDGP